MTSPVYVDTSFLYALIDEGDPRHAEVYTMYQDYEGGLLLSSYVFAETVSLVTKRFSKYQSMAAGTWIRESRRAIILHPTCDQFDSAWRLFIDRPESNFDVIDALSFVIMQQEKTQTVFSLDHHFAQMGFSVLPGASS